MSSETIFWVLLIFLMASCLHSLLSTETLLQLWGLRAPPATHSVLRETLGQTQVPMATYGPQEGCAPSSMLRPQLLPHPMGQVAPCRTPSPAHVCVTFYLQKGLGPLAPLGFIISVFRISFRWQREPSLLCEQEP